MEFQSNFAFIAGVSVISLVVLASVFLGYRKILSQLKESKKREEELKRKVYEAEVLREIGERIGYSLNGAKIMEIISGSLGDLLPYSVICYMIFDSSEKVEFACRVHEAVGQKYISDVRGKMLKQAGEMRKRAITNSEIEESISGDILDEFSKEPVRSYFNLPITISGKLVGMINVSSTRENLYSAENTEVLYRIANHASVAVSKLADVLENEKSRLSQAVQSLSDGVLMVNPNYHLVLVNKKLTQLLQMMENPRLFDIVNALSGSLDLRSLMEETVATGVEIEPREIVIREKVLQVMSSKVMDKKGEKILGVAVLFHDITDTKSLEKLRSDFTSMMVHELRAPLTSIKSTVELVRSDFSKLGADEIKKYLNTIESTGQSMLEVVNDLLDVAKMESGKFDVVCETGEVRDYIVDRVESFGPMVASKGIKISVDIPKNLPKVYFDKVRIKQVLNNLISNAIKFTQVGEIKVNVEVRSSNGVPVDIVIGVVDSGIGIDDEEGSRLFSRFGQLVRSRRTAALKGSGLGLFIAKGIVEAWGGKIWYKSEGAGMGSTFSFTIPVAGSAAAKEDESKNYESLKVMVSKVAQA